MAFRDRCAADRRAYEMNENRKHGERFEVGRSHTGEVYVGRFVDGKLVERIYA